MRNQEFLTEVESVTVSVAVTPIRMQPAGDELVISQSDGRVSRVGIATGGSIHSSGWVKEESPDPDCPAYNNLLSGISLQGRDTSELLDE